MLDFRVSMQSTQPSDYGVLSFPVLASPRFRFLFRPSPALSVCPSNCHGIISFADPHPLTLLESYLFKNSGGWGASATLRVGDILNAIVNALLFSTTSTLPILQSLCSHGLPSNGGWWHPLGLCRTTSAIRPESVPIAQPDALLSAEQVRQSDYEAAEHFRQRQQTQRNARGGAQSRTAAFRLRNVCLRDRRAVWAGRHGHDERARADAALSPVHSVFLVHSCFACCGGINDGDSSRRRSLPLGARGAPQRLGIPGGIADL